MAWLPAAPLPTLYSSLALGSVIVTPVRPMVPAVVTVVSSSLAFGEPRMTNVLAAPPVLTGNGPGPGPLGYTH